MELKDRIKSIRKKFGLNMEQFGARIGITKASVSRIESGENNPSEQTMILVCREFGVNEDWLRTGEGDPYIKRTRNQEIAAFMNDVMDLPDEAFKKEFIDRIRRLDEKDWEAIANIVDKLLKEG